MTIRICVSVKGPQAVMKSFVDSSHMNTLHCIIGKVTPVRGKFVKPVLDPRRKRFLTLLLYHVRGYSEGRTVTAVDSVTRSEKKKRCP